MSETRHHLFVPGRGLNFGQEITLNTEGIARVDTAANLYQAGEWTDESSMIYPVGAHPTLPEGMTELDLAHREGSLMQKRLVGVHGIDSRSVVPEIESTSTLTNVINFLHLPGAFVPDRHNVLGIVAGEQHARRFARHFADLGISSSGIEILPVEDESTSRIEDVSYYSAKIAGIWAKRDKSDVEARLLKADAWLERQNDRRAIMGTKVAKVLSSLGR